MDFDYIVGLIENNFIVKRTDVVEAKSYVLREKKYDLLLDSLIKEYSTYQDAALPEKITFNSNDELDFHVKKCSKYYEKTIALIEATNELINSNIYIPTSERMTGLKTNISVSSNGWSSGINLKSITLRIPNELKLSYSLRAETQIFDDEIFLRELNIPSAHKEVKESIRDSIRCFNTELYQPSIVMLGKAVEGSWIELGLALVKYSSKTKEKKDKEFDYLKGTDGIARKIERIYKLYTDKTEFNELHQISEVNHRVLEDTKNWSNLIRESRNAIHFGVNPDLPNTYEKVSILLMTAYKHFRSIYTIIESTRENES